MFQIPGDKMRIHSPDFLKRKMASVLTFLDNPFLGHLQEFELYSCAILPLENYQHIEIIIIPLRLAIPVSMIKLIMVAMGNTPPVCITAIKLPINAKGILSII